MDQEKYALAPLFSERNGVAVSLYVVVRRQHDPAAGWFVPLYQLADANVFLGCLCDARREVKEWLEIWVQTVSRREATRISSDAGLNNAFLDQRWRERADALGRLDPDSVFAGPWQHEHPAPLYFSRETWEPVVLANPQIGEQARWELCQHDALLKSAGLPAYTESGFRYLYTPAAGNNSKFVALDDGAPGGSRVLPANAAAGFTEDLVSFNPAGGLLFIRKHSPLTLQDFKRMLEGYGWQGAGLAVRKLLPGPAYEPFQEDAYFQNNQGLIFSGRRGRAGRVLECFLLKLLLFQDVMAHVASVIHDESRPFLNLRADDFGVRLSARTRGLPQCWGFQLNLIRTSESIALEVEGKGSRFFKALRGRPPSIYQPKQMSPYREGRGSVRVRDIRPGADGALVFEGTLADVEVFALGPSDSLWLELPVRGERLAFHARVLAAQNLADTEIRFETLPRSLADSAREALGALKGVPLPGVAFKVHPVASSPCDLYALAVIGLEILIDTNKISLAVALDECLSFARQIALRDSTTPLDRRPPLAARRARVLEAEPRFWNSLGPQNLCREPLERAEACQLVPPELWWGCFDILVRMLPGVDPTGWARDLGDVNAFALDTCFAQPLEEWEALIECTRSLLFIDWTANREIRKILDELAG